MSADDTAAQHVIAATRSWVERVVVGLELCPFAKAPHEAGRIRYVVSAARDIDRLAEDLERELQTLQAADPAEVETTLLIHPDVLHDFLQYNDFLDVAEQIVEELDLEGELQVASFHPDYRFADAPEDDPANYTNRSPYPMLHLLREASITRAVDSLDDPARIPARNVELLRRLGRKACDALFRGATAPN